MIKELEYVRKLEHEVEQLYSDLYFARMKLAKVCPHERIRCDELRREGGELWPDHVESRSYTCEDCRCIVKEVPEVASIRETIPRYI